VFHGSGSYAGMGGGVAAELRHALLTQFEGAPFLQPTRAAFALICSCHVHQLNPAVAAQEFP